MLMMKRWGHFYKKVVLPAFRGRVKYFPDTCGIHGHHRGKLQCKGLRRHTMRHFSIANLHKLASTHATIVANLAVAARKVPRVVGPVPNSVVLPLSVVIDVVFDAEAAHHKRKGAKKSQRMTDLHALAGMLNGCLLSNVVHHCWDDGSQRPCCDNDEDAHDKITVLLTHAMYGSSDPIPAESRWTHLLTNMLCKLWYEGEFL